MGDTFWLNVTNIGLGVVIFICVLVIAFGIAKDMLARRVRRTAMEAEMDGDLRAMVGEGGNLFAVPGLGLTMADGGEQTPPQPKKEKQ
ncbi:MAG: hypothetical protein NTY38_15775 [Acidobacteria bacterium]|nr:hypothetical protein [Acidobacteriota bacterium]